MYVCLCNQVTDKQIHSAVQEGVSNLQQLCQQLNIGTCCGCCKDCASEVFDAAQQRSIQAAMPILQHQEAYQYT